MELWPRGSVPRQRDETERRSQLLVSEIQPWRNPRPAPHLPEIQARLRPPRAPAWLRAWWPALLWAGGIFSMSADTFSAEHTGAVLERILHWLVPSITEDRYLIIHYFIRK